MNFRSIITIIILILCAQNIYGQSDYRITQEFKSRQRSFEIAIEYAKTVDELSKIGKEINEFRNEFKGNKELLNRALYPANFESSFDVLEKKIEFASKKLTQISDLEIEVTQLQSDYENISNELKKLSSEVVTLRSTNSRLMNELRAFRSGYGGSKEEIDSLRGLVNDLRKGISKRDTLIKDIMENIFMSAEHKIQSLNDAEMMSLKTKIEGTSLLDNIRNLVNDNIAFLDASLFNPEDLKSLGQELESFKLRWTDFGPKLFNIYSQDTQNKEKLMEVDSLLLDWDRALDLSTWNSINSVFLGNGIELEKFNNDSTFIKSITKYIDAEIANLRENLSVESEKRYALFADKTWNEIIKPDWISLLKTEDAISDDQIATIELKLDEWKDNLSGSKSYLIYGLIILLAIIIIVSLAMINKKKKKGSPNSVHLDESPDGVKSSESGGISEDDEFVVTGSFSYPKDHRDKN